VAVFADLASAITGDDDAAYSDTDAMTVYETH
jgi:hypothetical protein